MASLMRRSFAFAMLCALPLAVLAAEGGPPFPFDVNVVNPVLPVEVSNAEPIPVRDVGTGAALEPFRISTFFRSSESSSNTRTLIATVPADRRLIIEHVSWDAVTTQDGRVNRVTLSAGEDGPTMSVFKIDEISGQSFIGAAPVRLYFEPGEEVWAVVSGLEFVFRIYMHGQLVAL